MTSINFIHTYIRYTRQNSPSWSCQGNGGRRGTFEGANQARTKDASLSSRRDSNESRPRAIVHYHSYSPSNDSPPSQLSLSLSLHFSIIFSFFCIFLFALSLSRVQLFLSLSPSLYFSFFFPSFSLSISYCSVFTSHTTPSMLYVVEGRSSLSLL